MVKRTSLFGFSSRRSCKSSQNWSISASSALVVRGVDLDYCDVEWFALETNRDHSIIFEIAPSTEFRILLLTVRATPFLLRDSCPQ